MYVHLMCLWAYSLFSYHLLCNAVQKSLRVYMMDLLAFFILSVGKVMRMFKQTSHFRKKD